MSSAAHKETSEVFSAHKENSISDLFHYLKSGGNVPSWIRCVNVLMDNTGSTNKNQYNYDGCCT